MRLWRVLIGSIALSSTAAQAFAQAPVSPTTPASSEEAGAASVASETVPRDILTPEYPPPGTRTTLALTGAAVFAGWYAGAVGASLLWDDAPGAKELRYPLVGPWLSLQHTGCPKDERTCSTATVVVRAVVTAMDGIAQLGGLLAIGEALFLPTAPGLRAGSNSPQLSLRRESERAHIRAAPFVAGRDGVGLGVAGVF